MDLLTSKKVFKKNINGYSNSNSQVFSDYDNGYFSNKSEGVFKLREYLSKYSINQAFSNFIVKNIKQISPNISFDHDKNTITDKVEIDKLFQTIINLEPLDANNKLNPIFESTNTKLEENGWFFGVVENKLSFSSILKTTNIKNGNDSDNGVALNSILPSIRINYSRMSKVEILGRLSCFGFEIKHVNENMGSLFFIAEKKRAPLYVRKNQHGIFIKLPRICKNGKIKNFYKIRTMYPYAEYLQDYVFGTQGLQSGGKINDDFRISKFGRFLRRYWIDELPMLLNLLKGDIKLIGVRPLSRHYFNLYSEELQELRIKTKPGLIPPFYADMPKTLDEIMESEICYLKAYKTNPLLTDIKYLFLALSNILLKGHRSK